MRNDTHTSRPGRGRLARTRHAAAAVLLAPLRALRWAWRRIARFVVGPGGRTTPVTVAQVGRAALAFAVVVFVLAFSFAMVLIHYPATQIPKAEPIHDVRFLDQGWGLSRESPQRETYYYTPQGTSIKGLRYKWFVHLERPWGGDRFADPAYLRSLGFVVDLAPTPANPDLLPVGFARHYDEQLGDEVLDLTCAACHTGQLNVTRNGRTTGIRIDGGPAMHAFTAVDIGHFAPVLLGSLASTYANPIKFNRFARRVLGDAYDTGKGRLRGELFGVLRALSAQALNDEWHGLYPTEEGFGRTDALGRIANTVFGEYLDERNYTVANAPVSFPYLWNIWNFDWVQYTASVSSPMARNVGEAMGVGARFKLVDAYGRPVPASERYRTSVRFEDLQRIETTLQSLKPPPWPEDLLGPIDREKAERGRKIFEKTCRPCHGPHVLPDPIRRQEAPLRADDQPLWKIDTKDIMLIGTDPTSAANFSNHTVSLARMGLSIEDVKAVLRRQLTESQRRARVALAELSGEQLAAAQRDYAARLTGDAIENWLDQLDLERVNTGVALNIVGLMIREKYYQERGFSEDLIACYEGFGMLDTPRVLLGYKPRPLGGVWATAPYLHNGSVPNLYEMLSPAYERSRTFFVGRREFDPVKVGFVTTPLSEGGFWFDTRLTGNHNTGHEFRGGFVAFDEKNRAPQYGVIGPAFAPAERYDIIEYLKIHTDPVVPPPPGAACTPMTVKAGS